MSMERSKAETNYLNGTIGNAPRGIVDKLDRNTAVESTCVIQHHPRSRKDHYHDVVLRADLVM